MKRAHPLSHKSQAPNKFSLKCNRTERLQAEQTQKTDAKFASIKNITTFAAAIKQGQLPEWPNGADCNSAGLRLRWFESITAHLF